MIQINIKKLTPNAILPFKAHKSDAGYDLFATENTKIYEQTRELIGTGIAIELPEGYEAQVRPRSGLAHKHGLTVLNSPGTIDAGYRGEIKVNIFNSAELYEIKKGDKIAQMVIQKLPEVSLVLGDLSDSDRGGRGHGSTGK